MMRLIREGYLELETPFRCLPRPSRRPSAESRFRRANLTPPPDAVDEGPRRQIDAGAKHLFTWLVSRQLGVRFRDIDDGAAARDAESRRLTSRCKCRRRPRRRATSFMPLAGIRTAQCFAADTILSRLDFGASISMPTGAAPKSTPYLCFHTANLAPAVCALKYGEPQFCANESAQLGAGDSIPATGAGRCAGFCWRAWRRRRVPRYRILLLEGRARASATAAADFWRRGGFDDWPRLPPMRSALMTAVAPMPPRFISLPNEASLLDVFERGRY